MVSGHTCVPASIRLGDVGDTESTVIHDSLSEETYIKDILLSTSWSLPLLEYT